MGLKLVNINKSFGLGIKNPKQKVLDNVNIEIYDGEMVAIVGRRGSGKTTLMNIMTGLIKPDSGHYLIDGKVMGIGSGFKMAGFRANGCGIITKDSLLVRDMTLFENLSMPLKHRFMRKKKRLKRAREVLRGLGLKGKGKFYPGDFSPLDQQKICAGRAMIAEPKYIFADEPTGNLSSTDVDRFMDFLEVLNSAGYTIVVFTYSKRVASHCHRMIPVTGEEPAPAEPPEQEEPIEEPSEEESSEEEPSPEVHEIVGDEETGTESAVEEQPAEEKANDSDNDNEESVAEEPKDSEEQE